MELYYLHSRYYGPHTCRFVNADTTDILAAKGDLYDKNLFAYCDNNPVARVDDGGEFWNFIAGACIGAISFYVGDVIENVTDSVTGQESVTLIEVGRDLVNGLACEALSLGTNKAFDKFRPKNYATFRNKTT